MQKNNTWKETVCSLVVLVLCAPALVTAASLDNPLPNFPTVAKFVEGVLKAIVYVAMPIIALFIVYAGFKYVLARGSPDKLTEAHKNFVYVVIGALLILGAWVLATLIGGTVSQLVGTK
jgi:hypothetical protein